MTFAAAIERIGNEIDLGNLTPYEVAEILDRDRIVKALARFGWNQCAAADSMRIHRNTLMRRMEALGIEKPADAPTPRRAAGRPSTPAGELAKNLGMKTRTIKNNGLDREVSPLVMRIRMAQIARSTKQRRKRYQEKTEQVDRILAASERLAAFLLNDDLAIDIAERAEKCFAGTEQSA